MCRQYDYTGASGSVLGRGLGSRARIRNAGYDGGRDHRFNQTSSRNQPPHVIFVAPTQPQAHAHPQVAQVIKKQRHSKQDMIWGDIVIITAADILYIGLTYVGFGKD